eukprot:6193699-Pleurochrysis_carterae.AAC.1
MRKSAPGLVSNEQLASHARNSFLSVRLGTDLIVAGSDSSRTRCDESFELLTCATRLVHGAAPLCLHATPHSRALLCHSWILVRARAGHIAGFHEWSSAHSPSNLSMSFISLTGLGVWCMQTVYSIRKNRHSDSSGQR